MEISKEIITLSKIRDGLFIGDSRSGTNLDLLMQFKISHIINATGIPLPYSFESFGIKYLTISWLENPPENTIIIDNDLISNIICFIDESNIKGEGLLGFSVKGKNRICVIIILYLITKYNWSLKKCLEYVKKKKQDMEINNFYMNQLEIYEKNFFSKKNFLNSSFNWNNNIIKDKDELVMSNTYINEIKNNINKDENKDKNIINDKNPIIRKIIWGDNKKYVRQMAQPGLIHYNIDKDLFLKKNIEDITDHISKKPLRSCIKNNININSSININKINSTNKKRRTKIYLAADVHMTNSSNKRCSTDYKNEIKDIQDNQNELLLTQKNSNRNERNNNDNNKNIFEDILITEQNDDNKEKLFNEGNNKKKEKVINNNKPYNKNNVTNNLNIIKNIENNDSDDEIKLSIINIDNTNKEKNERKKDDNKETMKEFGFNIVNVEQKNNINKGLKPIINKLLKIDPNLETLNKYLKNQKKQTYINIIDNVQNYKINQNKNTNYLNLNLNSDIDKNKNNLNKEKKHTFSVNKVNLIPINTNNNNNITTKDKKSKPRSKEEKRKDNNKLFLHNFNLNTENNNMNIKNNNFTINKQNKVFKKKINNFFMDAYGNYPPGFNKKKRNINSARIEYQYNGNNKNFLTPNINYYLANNLPQKNKKGEKKENTIIPNINLNRNSQNLQKNDSNSQKNSNKNLKNKKNKIIKNPIMNKNKNNINKSNNNNLFITNIINSNHLVSFNRKESKFIFIIIYNFFFIYSMYTNNKK